MRFVGLLVLGLLALFAWDGVDLLRPKLDPDHPLARLDDHERRIRALEARG